MVIMPGGSARTRVYRGGDSGCLKFVRVELGVAASFTMRLLKYIEIRYLTFLSILKTRLTSR